jgi:hypothetical protein
MRGIREKDRVREALRIGFLAIASAATILAGIAKPKLARAEDQTTSFEERWPATVPSRCGGLRLDDYKPQPLDDYKTIERKWRARLKAILTSGP